MLRVGIVGLPNVGKSTLFNALSGGQANVSNYPFTTIDSNVGRVDVPDARLRSLETILKPRESTPCWIEFIDIAGLVEGASRGEGLGNQFLGNIRQVDLIAQVVRCFEEPDIVHVLPRIDPAGDVEVVETELLLADLDVLQRAIEKRERIWQTNPRQHQAERERWLAYQRLLETGSPLSGLKLDPAQSRELKGLGLLTGKPVLYVANLSEDEYQSTNQPSLQRLCDLSSKTPGRAEVAISARLEWELAQMDPEDRLEMIEGLGLAGSGLDRLVTTAFSLLKLITFYTIANQKLRAWELAQGTRAPQAAGKIHSDMEDTFVRAQVASFEEIQQHGSFQQLHRLGLLRAEGKDYQVQDGDVIEFTFAGP